MAAECTPTDAFDPWFCVARPVWSSLVAIIPVNDELLDCCVAAAILTEHQRSKVVNPSQWHPTSRRRRLVNIYHTLHYDYDYDLIFIPNY